MELGLCLGATQKKTMSQIERLEDIYDYDECDGCGGLYHKDRLADIPGEKAWDWRKFCKFCLAEYEKLRGKKVKT